MTRVKICGVRDVETAIAALEAGADFIGMVFADSRRKVTPQECYDIVAAVQERRKSVGRVQVAGPARGDVTARSWFGAWNEAIEETLFRARPLVVGVFADQDAANVNDIADAAGLDMVQLSGNEDEAFGDAIRWPVIRTLHVAEGDTSDDIFERARPGHERAIHLDTASPTARGGTGERFDWTIAVDVAVRLPVMLAGGLTPENVSEAVQTVRPWAVDVSSGVETGGTKDIEKVRAFIAAVKGADRGG